MRRIALFFAFISCAMPAFAGKPAKVGVTISPTTATAYSGTTKQFTAIVTGTSVAESTKKASATVTVNPAPSVLSRIVVSPASSSIYIGSTQQFSAVAYDQYGHTMSASLTYSSSNYSVAAIDSASGIATGEATGTANITAYSGNVVSNSVPIIVNPVPPPSPLSITRLSPNIGLVGMNGNFNSLTIIGTGFVSGATVNFGSTVLTPSAISSTSVTVTVPVSEFSTVRTVQVSVTNPGTAPSASLPFYIISQGFV